jgi:hypothetical protein
MVGRLELRGARARFEDRTFDDPVSFAVEDADVTLTGVSTEKGSRWGLETRATLFGVASVGARGEVGLTPIGAQVAVEASGLDLAVLQPYVARFLPLELRSGSFSSSGEVSIGSNGEGPLATFRGELLVEGVDVHESVVGTRLLQWDRVEVRGIEAAHEPQSLAVETIDIRGAGIELVVSEEGKVNLLELLAVMAGESPADGEPAGASPAATESAAADELPPIRVGTLNLHECSGSYTDRTMTPPYTLGLDELDGTIGGLSTQSTAGARIEIDGKVRSGGAVGVDGELDLFDPARLADVTIDVRGADLPPLSPMLVRYLGHPAVGGKADVGLDYEILSSELKGDNRLATQGFKLGGKVEGEGMLGLPVKLGVSLLTDKNGRMALEFPIEGNLDEPGFGVGNAIGAAVKEVTGQLVKSPFRLLGKLGGGKADEDYRFVEFEAGSAELHSNAVDKLRALAAGAAQRPGLVLQVAGVWDETVDAPALRQARVEALLAERAPADSSVTEPALDTMLAVAREQIPESDIVTLREQSLTPGESGAEPTLDETRYYRALNETVVAAQTIEPAALAALARARSESIRALLVDEFGADGDRLQLLEPTAAKKPSEDEWVRLELEIAARD